MSRLPSPVDETIELFLSHSHKRQYPAKSTIIFEDDKPDTLYYIISGSVAVLKGGSKLEPSKDSPKPTLDSQEDTDGKEIVLAYLNPGDFFGEMGLFDEETKRSAFVQTRAKSEIAAISYSRFKQLFDKNPDLLFRLASQMALRLKKTSGKVGDLAFIDVTGRVARTLMELAKEPDAMTHPDGMQIKITRQEIGRIVGCSREMVGRVLKELEEQGLIEVKGKTMVIYGTR